MVYRSRAVRSLVELHEREMRSFLATWSRYAASDLPMPEAHGDEAYENRERLLAHVLMAARGYLTRIGEWVGRPVTDVDATTDPYEVAGRAREFIEEVLAAYLREMLRVARPGGLVAFTLTPRTWHTSIEILFRARRWLKERRAGRGPRGLYQREWVGIRPARGTVQRLSPVPLTESVMHGDKWLFHCRKETARTAP